MAHEGRNILTYLGGEFQTFAERPLCEVDSLVLSCLSYYRLPEEFAAARTSEGMALAGLFCAERFEAMTCGLWDPEGLVQLLAAAVASPRLRGTRVCGYVDEFDEVAEKQFSAVTLRLPGGGAYVSFRGTDNTLVGWREDFNMAFETGVPSQLAAVDYLCRAAREVDGPLWVGGHSKGGNLAVYAASRCPADVAARLRAVFSHDGPGFTAETLAEPAWRDRARLVHKTVPRSSLIGMLFEQQEDYSVVASTATGPLQHDPFSWVVEGTDFVREEGLGRGASFVDEGLNEWITSMTPVEREGFVEALFSVLNSGGKDSFGSLKESWQTSLPAMARELAGLGPSERANIARAVRLLVRAFAPDFEVPRLPELETLLPGGLLAERSPGEGEPPDGVSEPPDGAGIFDA